jgi:hypothetical protein
MIGEPEIRMKLLLEGWDRHELNHTVVDGEISEFKEPYLNALGEVRVLAKAENLSLNGNFEVTVCLTKDEIARLARIAFAEDLFSDVLNALSQGTRLKPPDLKLPNL